MTVTVIACACDEARLFSPCLSSLNTQTRLPDAFLVLDNACTDETAAVAREVPGVQLVDEPVTWT